MHKRLFQLAIAIGLGLFAYIYLYDFDKLSETEMIDAVLYWYVPLIFGIYGLIALRIENRIPNENDSLIKYVFSGKDVLLLIIVIFLAIFGLLGFALLIIPLSLFKVNSENFAMKVALTGSVLMLVLLFLFFQVLWPTL